MSTKKNISELQLFIERNFKQKVGYVSIYEKFVYIRLGVIAESRY